MRAIRKTTERPTHPNGEKFRFNCCASPDVWDFEDNSQKCRNCGTDWTKVLGQ